MIDESCAEFQAVQQFYGDKTAKRSGVPLIQHIREGLIILDRIRSTEEAQKAFCLHPLFQQDEDLAEVGKDYAQQLNVDAYPVMLTMEYRARANGWLSEKVSSINEVHGFPLAGQLGEVAQMLIADKVQNRKDFELYHKGTHARSAELDLYFKMWLTELNISEACYAYLVGEIKKVFPPL